MYGGHPDHGMSGVASQGSAGTGMESAYGGAAIGVPGGLAAGQNEMGAFLDAMTQRYGPQSVKNFVDNYLNRHFNQRTLGQPLGIPAQGYRDLNYESQTTALAPKTSITPESTTPQAQINRTPFDQFGLNYFDEGVHGTHPAVGNMFDSPSSQELEMSGRMTPAQLAALDAAQQKTQNFTAFDQGFIDQMMESQPSTNYGPEYAGGGDRYIPPYWIQQDNTHHHGGR